MPSCTAGIALHRLPVIVLLGNDGLPEAVENNRVVPVFPDLLCDVLFNRPFEGWRECPGSNKG